MKLEEPSQSAPLTSKEKDAARKHDIALRLWEEFRAIAAREAREMKLDGLGDGEGDESSLQAGVCLSTLLQDHR
jgi:hypothetical protein